ncbi:GNAT family N-acetyltransferase [Pedobacter panaciterrae]|uniref:GNAT family N-acetyltransferase n=1 Tax=Pedobacter panaciterrae TaxID=363849 RepID=UPI00155D9AC8|nr:N-acetyltransferase [Pedobacter panaciterrae]NQX56187.1 GNAT family N-acetyltransferase [Pedobacter panaciterrae]
MIRQALATDAPQIARLIIHAMEDPASKFVGQSDPLKAIPLFEHFAGLRGNQYSYENMLVYEDESGICGAISGYDGADLNLLRSPFLNYIASSYNFKDIPEDETQPGEFYIDCISVAANKQGQGIGKKLINAMVGQLTNSKHTKAGLLVSKDNPNAERLYTNLGFKIADERQFMGGTYYHMQCAV